MEALDPVSSVLKGKPEIYNVAPNSTVLEALTLMADKGIGAVLVMDGPRLVGVFSERDYARKVILLGRSAEDTLVSQIMSSPPITITESCSVGEAMRLMTERRIRHLPVLDKSGSLTGVLSIGDLVKWIITTQQAVIEQLHSYIAGHV